MKCSRHKVRYRWSRAATDYWLMLRSTERRVPATAGVLGWNYLCRESALSAWPVASNTKWKKSALLSSLFLCRGSLSPKKFTTSWPLDNSCDNTAVSFCFTIFAHSFSLCGPKFSWRWFVRRSVTGVCVRLTPNAVNECGESVDTVNVISHVQLAKQHPGPVFIVRRRRRYIR